MNIPELLSTKERVKVLNFIICKTTSLNVNKVANELKLSKGLVSKFFDILMKESILIRKKNDFFIYDNITATLKTFLDKLLYLYIV